MNETIAVIMPAYNHAAYVAETMHSIMGQDLPVHLIGINDGSTDDTWRVMQATAAEYPEAEIQLINQANVGLCRTLNRGLREVDTPFVTFIASDDRFMPHVFAAMRDTLATLPESTAGVYGHAWKMDEHGVLGDEDPAPPATPVGPSFIDFLYRRDRISLQSSMFRTAIFDEGAVGPFDEDLVYEDRDFFLRLLRRYRLHYLGIPTVQYRVLDTGLRKHLYRAAEDRRKILEKHYDAPELKPFGGRELVRQLIAEEYVRCAKGAARANEHVESASLYRRAIRFGARRKGVIGRAAMEHALALSQDGGGILRSAIKP